MYSSLKKWMTLTFVSQKLNQQFSNLKYWKDALTLEKHILNKTFVIIQKSKTCFK